MSTHAKKSLGAQPFLYPEPTLLVSTYDADGKPNFMTAAWGGICSSDPVSLCVSLRAATYSHGSILARKAFTIGIPSEKMVAEMDFAGLASGRKYDKFATCGFTAVKAEHVDAPYIAECPVILECSLSQVVELGLHTMFIGAIRDVKADDNCLDPTGTFPDIEKVLPILVDVGSRNYYNIGKQIGKCWSIGKPLLLKKGE